MKVWNYMIIMLTMMIFLEFVGIPLYTSGNQIYNSIGLNISSDGSVVQADVGNSTWLDYVLGTAGLITLAGVGAAIVVGFFTKTFDWKLVLVGFFTSYIVAFASVGKQVIDIAIATGEGWLVGIIVTIFVPLGAMFIFSVVEWFGGND